MYSPELNTYFAKDCIKVAGHVGGAVSSSDFLSLKVSSKPNPLGSPGQDILCTLPSPCKSDRPKLNNQRLHINKDTKKNQMRYHSNLQT